jgi:5-methylcytosine-specific restriction endonuclease McrA
MSTKKGDPRLSRKYKEVRLRVLARDGYVCYYCGAENKNMTIDHVIPVSKAPELAISEENMRTCCVSCNSSKGSRNERVFLEKVRTPPVFSSRISPMQSEQPTTSPFKLRPDPIQ